MIALSVLRWPPGRCVPEVLRTFGIGVRLACVPDTERLFSVVGPLGPRCSSSSVADDAVDVPCDAVDVVRGMGAEGPAGGGMPDASVGSDAGSGRGARLASVARASLGAAASVNGRGESAGAVSPDTSAAELGGACVVGTGGTGRLEGVGALTSVLWDTEGVASLDGARSVVFLRGGSAGVETSADPFACSDGTCAGIGGRSRSLDRSARLASGAARGESCISQSSCIGGVFCGTPVGERGGGTAADGGVVSSKNLGTALRASGVRRVGVRSERRLGLAPERGLRAGSEGARGGVER